MSNSTLLCSDVLELICSNGLDQAIKEIFEPSSIYRKDQLVTINSLGTANMVFHCSSRVSPSTTSLLLEAGEDSFLEHKGTLMGPVKDLLLPAVLVSSFFRSGVFEKGPAIVFTLDEEISGSDFSGLGVVSFSSYEAQIENDIRLIKGTDPFASPWVSFLKNIVKRKIPLVEIPVNTDSVPIFQIPIENPEDPIDAKVNISTINDLQLALEDFIKRI